MLFSSSILFLLGSALAHVPFMDDGSHISYATAFEYYDEIIARSFNIDFDCPSLPVYTKVSVKNTTSFHVGYGLPNITQQIDYRPNIWVVGETVIVPEGYEDSTEGYDIDVPYGYNAFRVDSAANDFLGVYSEGDDVSFAIVGSIQVNITTPNDVYLIVEPESQRRARVWLAVGRTEKENPDEPGMSDQLVVDSWYVAETFPRIGQECST